jgi:hypothetical protein
MRSPVESPENSRVNDAAPGLSKAAVILSLSLSVYECELYPEFSTTNELGATRGSSSSIHNFR